MQLADGDLHGSRQLNRIPRNRDRARGCQLVLGRNTRDLHLQ
jgi:hypothetical protein